VPVEVALVFDDIVEERVHAEDPVVLNWRRYEGSELRWEDGAHRVDNFLAFSPHFDSSQAAFP